LNDHCDSLSRGVLTIVKQSTMKLLNTLFLTRSFATRCLSVMIMLIPFTTQAFDNEKSQSFNDMKNINVKTISGGLTLLSSNSREIEVTVFSTYDDSCT
jgi:hypothetical protein